MQGRGRGPPSFEGRGICNPYCLAFKSEVHARKLDRDGACRVAKFRDLRLPRPLVKYRSPSCQTGPTPAVCGRPSGSPCRGRIHRADPLDRTQGDHLPWATAMLRCHIDQDSSLRSACGGARLPSFGTELNVGRATTVTSVPLRSSARRAKGFRHYGTQGVAVLPASVQPTSALA